MTWRGTVAVERMDGSAAARAEDAFRLIYAEAFAEPPYDETEEDVAAAFRRFPLQTRNRAFSAALARSEDGEPVGMAYGYPLGPDTGWWDELTEPVPEDMRREDGHRTFGLMELAVRGPWRGRGVARRLHEELLDGIGAERVLLNVHPGSTAASAAYRAWGYSKIGEARPWGQSADLHDVMLLGPR
ncbi:GNAT family N-acetyltransferase [Streptomyces sp. HB132]|uniref:GNAT family N-acetyltransferase n=1 Tax=Streptomyces sp. HB132 TaxID=767388 RepID=UPI0019621296|nr:GNAT family N-acetyltransferase [Streptomyces sp. HB132]MBM7437477.1 ribosomal protein S18 acetylase RimI-like enzyme [Streptomyces sp. HB132]